MENVEKGTSLRPNFFLSIFMPVFKQGYDALTLPSGQIDCRLFS
jgi:hypothetical protein